MAEPINLNLGRDQLKRSDESLLVRKGTTDQQLIEILEKYLPDVLVRRFKLDPLRAKQVAPALARKIVEGARLCTESHKLREVSSAVELIRNPSEQQCEEFKEWADSILVVRYGEIKGNTFGRGVKTTAGKLWYLIQTLAGTADKWDDESGGDAADVRG